jgi:elongator complex protein 3
LNQNEAIQEIIKNLMQIPSPSQQDLNRFKTTAALRHKLERTPGNSEIIRMLKAEERRRLLPLLRRKATRTVSGITVVATMSKPHPCPQDAPCAYCPGGPQHGVPQSYTGFEPAAMRALQNDFDPYMQVKARIEQLEAIGHGIDKIELIIMGGTFPATPLEYQRWFVQRSLDAITGRNSTTLEEAKMDAETSRLRNVGVTVETRPDWAKETHVDRMLAMGVTRVEMGVQFPSDQVYRLIGRKHSVADVVEATRIMKDAGLKVVYHLMPGLPGTSKEKDFRAFRKIFTNPGFKPDMLKIYPSLVLKGTKAFDWYREDRYVPYTTEEAADFIAEVKRIIPPWVRVMRVQRDIPARLIVAGVKKSNLRQLVYKKTREKGYRCRCIRCREVGHRMREEDLRVDPKNVQILAMRYEASEGQEIFISAEDPENDVLIGYLRVRVPSEKAHRPEVKATPCTIVRELHVYGSLVPVGEHFAEAWQHKGYGSILLAKAERMTVEDYGFKKILVISALGTKQYYKRFGYNYDGVYMSKMLEN